MVADLSIAVVDRMLWLPKDGKLNLPKLREELTTHTTPFQGKPESFKIFEEGPDWFGVPRNWGLNQEWLMSGRALTDSTALPYLKWPVFTGGWRAGQQESVSSLLHAFTQQNKYGGLLEAKTGTGKTVMGTAIASNLNTPTLVIVHKEDLADQWKMLLTGGTKSGVHCPPLFPGGTVGHIQGDKWDYEGKHLVTAMAQTLFARIGREPADFYRQFGCIIFDEGHRYPARTFEQVMRLPHARYRLAVSATWRRGDGLEHVWHWHIGNVEHRAKASQMIGKYVQVPWNTSVSDSMFRMRGGRVNGAKFISTIGASAPYNKWLADEVIKGAKAGRKMLLVSHRTDQLADLHARIQSIGAGVTVGYYAGKVAGRTIKKDELEVTKQCQIILATFAKMSEGTDIPTLDTLYLVTPAADVEQVVGRIQRPSSGKRWLLIVDPVWQTGYNKALAAKRVKVYDRLGFTAQGEKT